MSKTNSRHKPTLVGRSVLAKTASTRSTTRSGLRGRA
jgi:hypothetical protein